MKMVECDSCGAFVDSKVYTQDGCPICGHSDLTNKSGQDSLLKEQPE